MNRLELNNVISVIKKDVSQLEVAIDIFSNAINSDISDQDLVNLIYNTNIHSNELFNSIKSNMLQLMVPKEDEEELQDEDQEQITDEIEEEQEDEEELEEQEENEEPIEIEPKEKPRSLRDSLKNLDL